jgi:uncharacterized protein YggU (UPF0235/DUF167 family)
MNDFPVRCVEDGVTVAVRLTPKAKTSEVNGLIDRPDGAALKVSVTAAPERNKANAALLALLAKTWHVPKTSLRVVGGQTDRNKLIHVAGDPEGLRKTLNQWIAAHYG